MTSYSSRQTRLTAEEAEGIAIQALLFLAAEEARLGKFLAATGYEPEAIRAEAGSPHFLAGVLDFLMGDESLLLVFASHSGIDPVRIRAARHVLAPDPDEAG